MHTPEPNPIAWRTSSYTAGQGNCVELGSDRSGVLVRDTKDRDGGTLAVAVPSWRGLHATLRSGR